MALVILFSAFMALANTCPASHELRALPVHDQDGLGTCASNTAALMMQYNLGLSESPSYYQLSLTASGNDKNTFFFNDSKGTERVFNWGHHICDVIKKAKDHGYCTSSSFGLDAINRNDPEQAQQNFLINISRFVDANEAGLNDLKIKLRDPVFQSQARQKLAGHFLNRSQTCQENFLQFVTRRGVERFKQWLSGKRNVGTLSEKVKYDIFWRSSFGSDGTPKKQTIDYYGFFLRTDGKKMMDSNVNNSPSLSVGDNPDEKVFAESYAKAMGMSGIVVDLPYRSMYQSDYDAYAICRGNDVVSGSSLLLTQTPLCIPVPESAQLSNFLLQADNLIQSLLDYTRPQLDPQAGLVNLISPQCAVEMTQTKNNNQLRCNEMSISNAKNASRAKERIYSDLCSGKAVAISMCTGFFKASAPINSGHCENDVQGVQNHGKHALTLIGYRSVGGKKQIKIQNSWGTSCPFLQNNDEKIAPGLIDSVECERNEGGSVTGRFWVDEDLLINNSYQLSVMP